MATALKTYGMALKEYFLLFLIRFKVQCLSFVEYLRVIFKYYPDIEFFKIDTCLLLSYLFANPFRISKQFLLKRGERDLYTYGETPLTTLDHIARTCGLTSDDTVVELGCGRGRTCFWLHQFMGCRVIGIDYLPTFIVKASKVRDYFRIEDVEFRLEDLFQADLRGATVIYLYGTCYSVAQICQLIDHFSNLPERTKIITVSYALPEFNPEAPFKILKQFPASFPWEKRS